MIDSSRVDAYPSPVFYYRRQTPGAWNRRHLTPPIGLAVSATAFLSAFILVSTSSSRSGVRTAVGQIMCWVLIPFLPRCGLSCADFGMQLVATYAQLLSMFNQREDAPKLLQNYGATLPRIESLTAIILGEGLNSICSTLHLLLGDFDVPTPRTMANLTAVLLTLSCIWLLYFDGKYYEMFGDK